MRMLAETTVRAAILIAAVSVGSVAPALAKSPPPSNTSDRASSPDFEWHEPLAAGKTVFIKGVSGSIEASLASGKEVEVTARKHANHSDPDEVRIEIAKSDDGVTICAVYPSSKGENSCESGDDWHTHTNNNDVQVDFTVKIPAGVAFTALNVNGDVEARGLKGQVDLKTVNGSVRFETTGYGMASTVNGGITAVLGSGKWPDPLEFRTVNGTIDITLPGDVSAKVSGSTMNGHIESDFPITVKGKVGPRSIHGTIGSGGSELECENINGNIRLRSATQ